VNLLKPFTILGVLIVALSATIVAFAQAEDLDDWAYQSGLVVENDSGSNLSNTPIAVPFRPANLIANGYMQADAEDGRIVDTSGAPQSFIRQTLASTAATWWLDVDSLVDGGSKAYVFHTGNASATLDQAFRLTSGDSISTPDHADLDIASQLYASTDVNFVEWPSSDAYILQKGDAYAIGARTDGGTKKFFAFVTNLPLAPDNPETIRPDADGDLEQWTVNGCTDSFDCVNEVVADDDATRLTLPPNQTNQDTRLTLSNVTAPTDSEIVSVTVHHRSKSSTAADSPRAIAPLLRLGTNQTTGSNVSMAASYANYSEALARPGGGSWSVADLNNLVVGIRGNTGATVTLSVTQVWVVIVYTVANYVEVEVAEDENGDPLDIETEYSVTLTHDGGAVELSVSTDGVLDPTGDGFDGANADFSIFNSSNSLDSGPGLNGKIDNINVSSLKNLAQNASFERSTVGEWSINSGCAAGIFTGEVNSIVSDDVKFGDQSFRIAWTNNDTTAMCSGQAQNIPVTAGLQYTVSVWFKTISGGTNVRLIVHRVSQGGSDNALGTNVGASTCCSEWTRFSQTFTAASGSTSYHIHIYGRADSTGTAVDFRSDGFIMFQGTGTIPWKGTTNNVLQWTFEPDEVDETQKGTAANSWNWIGTIEDVSVGGSDHDGTYTFVRDMSGVNAYLTGLQIKDLSGLVITQETLDILGIEGIDPTDTGVVSTFPFFTLITDGLGNFSTEFTLQWAWAVIGTFCALVISIFFARFPVLSNTFFMTAPFPIVYWAGNQLVGLELWIMILFSIIALGIIGGLKALSRSSE
jgi:hypothetical protein